MTITTLARRTLLVLQATVAATAIAGGVTLVIGSVNPAFAPILTPPQEYLAGSPFPSYLVPGILLGGLLGGVHVAAFLMHLKEHRWGVVASAVAGFAALIWIFVQMVFIPFSFLQAAYFTAGVAEAGLVMVLLGLFTPVTAPHRARTTYDLIGGER